MGSGETGEATGGDGWGWGSDGYKAWEGVGPCGGFPLDGEGLLTSTTLNPLPSSSCSSVSIGPEGDGDEECECSVSGCSSIWRSSCCCISCGTVGGVTGLVGSGANAGSSSAHPFVVPDLGHGFFSGVTGVTDGTEGFTPTLSVSDDLSGEGAPSTDALGGVKGSPELLVGWLGS